MSKPNLTERRPPKMEPAPKRPRTISDVDELGRGGEASEEALRTCERVQACQEKYGRRRTRARARRSHARARRPRCDELDRERDEKIRLLFHEYEARKAPHYEARRSAIAPLVHFWRTVLLSCETIAE